MTIAHHLKYWGHDVLSAGLFRNTPDTLKMLSQWADRIIVTDKGQYGIMSADPKVQLWDVGPDNYPRPFNKQLLARVRTLMEEHRSEYKQ